MTVITMNKLLSLIVFIIISSVVFLGGYLSVLKGLDSGSNLELVAQALDKLSPEVVGSSVSVADPTPAVSGQPLEHKCGIPNFDSLPDTDSLIEFLDAVGLDSSPYNRKVLASRLGIDNYTGSVLQNLNIIFKIKKLAGCI